MWSSTFTRYGAETWSCSTFNLLCFDYIVLDGTPIATTSSHFFGVNIRIGMAITTNDRKRTKRNDTVIVTLDCVLWYHRLFSLQAKERIGSRCLIIKLAVFAGGYSICLFMARSHFGSLPIREWKGCVTVTIQAVMCPFVDMNLIRLNVFI